MINLWNVSSLFFFFSPPSFLLFFPLLSGLSLKGKDFANTSSKIRNVSKKKESKNVFPLSPPLSPFSFFLLECRSPSSSGNVKKGEKRKTFSFSFPFFPFFSSLLLGPPNNPCWAHESSKEENEWNKKCHPLFPPSSPSFFLSPSFMYVVRSTGEEW